MKLCQQLSHSPQRGSSLIEIIVATGVMALVLTAIVAGLTLSLKTNAEAEYRSQAVKRSQEAMEVFRRERTLRGWDGFVAGLTDNASYCFQTLPAPEAELESGECDSSDAIVISGIEFFRQAEVEIDDSSPSDVEVRVEMRVFWNTGSGQRSVNLVQTFRQWD